MNIHFLACKYNKKFTFSSEFGSLAFLTYVLIANSPTALESFSIKNIRYLKYCTIGIEWLDSYMVLLLFVQLDNLEMKLL